MKCFDVLALTERCDRSPTHKDDSIIFQIGKSSPTLVNFGELWWTEASLELFVKVSHLLPTHFPFHKAQLDKILFFLRLRWCEWYLIPNTLIWTERRCTFPRLHQLTNLFPREQKVVFFFLLESSRAFFIFNIHATAVCLFVLQSPPIRMIHDELTGVLYTSSIVESTLQCIHVSFAFHKNSGLVNHVLLSRSLWTLSPLDLGSPTTGPQTGTDPWVVW